MSKQRYAVMVDGSDVVLRECQSADEAHRYADEYNDNAESGSDLAYAYMWDSDNEEWLCI